MSVATQLVPTVSLPPHARLRDDDPARFSDRPVDGLPGSQRLATVVTLHRPSARAIAAPVRLTRRGVAVLAVAVGVLAAGLVWLAWLSAPGTATTGPSRPVAPVAITVQPGDTLWSIATHVAPDRDPRAEVARLQRLNHLSSADLATGQVLRLR
jgi:LysM repeat protein